MKTTFTYQFFINETLDITRDYVPSVEGYVPGAHMKLAYVGEIDGFSINIALETLFEKFNIDHPKDYTERSMSVGDVVVLNGVAYECASVGWKRLGSFVPEINNPAWTTRW
jgi:hypothetical protein